MQVSEAEKSRFGHAPQRSHAIYSEGMVPQNAMMKKKSSPVPWERTCHHGGDSVTGRKLKGTDPTSAGVKLIILSMDFGGTSPHESPTPSLV